MRVAADRERRVPPALEARHELRGGDRERRAVPPRLRERPLGHVWQRLDRSNALGVAEAVHGLVRVEHDELAARRVREDVVDLARRAVVRLVQHHEVEPSVRRRLQIGPQLEELAVHLVRHGRQSVPLAPRRVIHRVPQMNRV